MSNFAANTRSSRAQASRLARRRSFVPNLDTLESRLAPSATYFVSPSGNDSNNGLSEASAWRTLNRVNLHQPRPGDTILLQGGQTFSGTLEVFRGDPTNVISIDSYGGGRATISSGNQFGIYGASPGGLHVRNLRVVGSGAENNNQSGIVLTNDGRLASNFIVEDVEVTGYGVFGAYVWADAGGMSDVLFSRVDAHHNANGMHLGDLNLRTLANVVLSEVKAWENDKVGPSLVAGFGVSVAGVNDLLIQSSVFAHNGLRGPGGGHTGLHVQDSGRVRVEYNESYGNNDPYQGDGIGIVLSGVQDAVAQYNYTHDNRGAGILVWTDVPGHVTSRVSVRYNISQNDTVGLNVSGEVYDTVFYNNTVYASAQAEGEFRAGVILMNWAGRHVNFLNNIFMTAGNAPQVMVDEASMASAWSLGFVNNAYYYATSPSSLYLIFGGRGYYSLDEFRAWTGNEVLSGLPVGVALDPELVSAGGGWDIGNPYDLINLTPYWLLGSSPLSGAGLDLQGLLGLDTGGQDFFSNPLPVGVGFSIGAYQAPVGTVLGATGGEGDFGVLPLDPLALLAGLDEAPATGEELGELAGVDWAAVDPEAYSWELAYQATRLLDASVDPDLGHAWTPPEDWAAGVEYPLFELSLPA